MSLKVVINDNIHASVPSAHISTSISGNIQTPQFVDAAIESGLIDAKIAAATKINISSISKSAATSPISAEIKSAIGGGGGGDWKSWVLAQHYVSETQLDEYHFIDAATLNTILQPYATQEWVNITKENKKPYISLVRKTDYLYEITFDSIPQYEPLNTYTLGGCTSFVKDGKLYRNLDWTYDDAAEFLVKTKNFTGMSFIAALKDGQLDNKENLLGQLPYHINDGVNHNGLMVSTHVLFNDFDYHGSGEKTKSITLLPFTILNTMTEINTLSEEVEDILTNTFIPTELGDMLVQVLITDGIITKLFTPTENGYEYINISTRPKLTNFKWIDKARIDLHEDAELLQLRPTGIERWNLIDTNPTLNEMRFTKVYETPNYLSEFIGARETTKYSSFAQLEEIYNIAHQLYEKRTRDGSLWQTLHSVIYSPDGIQSLFVQENYNNEIIPIRQIKTINNQSIVGTGNIDIQSDIKLSIIDGQLNITFEEAD